VDSDHLLAEKEHFQALAASALQILVDDFEGKTGSKLADVYITIIDTRTDVAVPCRTHGAGPRTVSVSVRLESVAEQLAYLKAIDTPADTYPDQAAT